MVQRNKGRRQREGRKEGRKEKEKEKEAEGDEKREGGEGRGGNVDGGGEGLPNDICNRLRFILLLIKESGSDMREAQEEAVVRFSLMRKRRRRRNFSEEKEIARSQNLGEVLKRNNEL